MTKFFLNHFPCILLPINPFVFCPHAVEVSKESYYPEIDDYTHRKTNGRLDLVEFTNLLELILALTGNSALQD